MVTPARLEKIGEIVGTGVVGGGTAAVIVLAGRGVADVGDLLGFVGAAVGAFLTIGGAIWTTNRQRTVEEARFRDGMRDSLLVAAEGARMLSEATPDKPLYQLKAMLLTIEQGHRAASALYARAPFADAKTATMMSNLDTVVPLSLAEIRAQLDVDGHIPADVLGRIAERSRRLKEAFETFVGFSLPR